MVYGAWDYGARRPGQARLVTCPRTSFVTRTPGAGRASRSPSTHRRTCGRRGWRCGTTRTNAPSSWRCSKTVRDWRCGTNASNSDSEAAARRDRPQCRRDQFLAVGHVDRHPGANRRRRGRSEPMDDAQGHRPDQQRSAGQPRRELVAGNPRHHAVSRAAGRRPAVPAAGHHRDARPVAARVVARGLGQRTRV